MNSLTVIDQPTNAEIWRTSTDAASLCKDIVLKRAINLQGKRYVPVEGWQAIALAHGCIAGADNVRLVDGGIAADGVIRRMSDGAEIARAEGFVGDDEKTWASRPMFARRGMAQTRAISRACRSAFAHVVVMMDVGLETTPFEEMQGIDDARPATPPAPEPKRDRDLKAAAPDRKAAERAKAEDWLAAYLEGVASMTSPDDLFAFHVSADKPLTKLHRHHRDLWHRANEAMEARHGLLVGEHYADDEPAETSDPEAEITAEINGLLTIVAVNDVINSRIGELDEAAADRVRNVAMHRIAAIREQAETGGK